MTPKSQAKEALSQANKEEAGMDRPVYEVSFHLVPAIPEDGVAAVVERVRAALGDAEIITEQFPARMTLAYPIERSVQGKREKYHETYFGWVKFALERQALPTLQEKLRSTQQVLRFLVVETIREEAAPRRAVFTSSRLEGETIKKPEAAPEKVTDVSEEELDKSIDALVS